MSKFARLVHHDWKMFDDSILLAICSDFIYPENLSFFCLLGWISDSLELSRLVLQQGVINICVFLQDIVWMITGIFTDEHYCTT